MTYIQPVPVVSGQAKLNLGCGNTRIDGWVNIDCTAHPSVDLIFDLEKCSDVRLPFDDDSVSEIRGAHFIEHIQNTLPLMQELHRVARANTIAKFHTPYGSSDDAYEDPTHVRPYFLNSWNYFAQPTYWRADYRYRGDWQPEALRLVVDQNRHVGETDELVRQRIRHERNIVMEMIVVLRCVKPIRPANRDLIRLPMCEIFRQ